MKKQPKKKTRFEELDEKGQKLQRRLMQAYSAGMSHGVIHQIEAMIEQNNLDMYDEREMEKHRASQKNDGDDGYIV